MFLPNPRLEEIIRKVNFTPVLPAALDMSIGTFLAWRSSELIPPIPESDLIDADPRLGTLTQIGGIYPQLSEWKLDSAELDQFVEAAAAEPAALSGGSGDGGGDSGGGGGNGDGALHVGADVSARGLKLTKIIITHGKITRSRAIPFKNALARAHVKEREYLKDPYTTYVITEILTVPYINLEWGSEADAQAAMSAKVLGKFKAGAGAKLSAKTENSLQANFGDLSPVIGVKAMRVKFDKDRARFATFFWGNRLRKDLPPRGDQGLSTQEREELVQTSEGLEDSAAAALLASDSSPEERPNALPDNLTIRFGETKA